MDTTEFRKICEETVSKHYLMRKIVCLGIVTWMLLISGIELVMLSKVNYVTVPILVTCVIAFVICTVWLVNCLVEYSDIRQEEKRRKKEYERERARAAY